jgi:PAS domain S-box-containing protein
MTRLLSAPGAPLSSPGRGGRLVLFGAAAVFSLAIAALPPTPPRTDMGWAALLLGVIGLAVWQVPWKRIPAGWQAAPAFAFFGVVGLLRDAGGGLGSGLAPLVLLPVVWLALYHRRRVMVAGLLVAGSVLLGPVLVVGAPAYPSSEWRRAVVMVAIAAAMGLTTHWLVERLRQHIGDLAAAEGEARAEARFSGAILDGAAMLVTVQDPTGRLTLVNREWERVTGYSAAVAVARYPWQLLAGPEAESAPARFQETLLAASPDGAGPPAGQNTGAAPRTEVLRSRSGERRVVSWRYTALTGDTGDLTHVIGTGLDVTDQQNTATLLTSVLAAVTEQALIGTDLDGVITVFNSGAERLLGHRAGDVIGSMTAEVFRDGDALGPTAGLAALAAGGPWSGEWSLIRADGTHVPVAVTVTRMHNDAGLLIGHLATARDVTTERTVADALAGAYAQQKATADKLRELNQARTRFLAAAAHDLRTPLTGVLSFLDLLAEHDHEPDARQLLDGAHRNAQRLATHIANLLTVSQLDAGALILDRRPTQLGEVLRAAADAVPDHRDLTVEVTVPEPEPVIDGDAVLLSRAIGALVDNAVKFTPDGGRIGLAVRRVGSQAQIQVRDTGVGIAEEELPHLFERFYRTARTRELITGAGLGLAIAKGVAEANGGRITVTSGVEEGTTVTISLPCASGTAAGDIHAREGNG